MVAELQVVETDEIRPYWLSLGLGSEHLSQIASADALIVPEKDFREGVKFVFHQDTTALFGYLSKEFEGKLAVELCANDDEYLEIALHSNTLRISTIVVNMVVAPLLIGLLTNYIYDHAKAKGTDTVEMSLIVEGHEGRGVKLTYKGDAKDFHLISDKIKELVETQHIAKKKVSKKKLVQK